MTMSQNLTSEMVCTICRKHKAELRARKSKLMPGMQMFLCNSCFTNNYEPRFLVIMVGRRDGVEAIADYLKRHRYVGDDILASDLL